MPTTPDRSPSRHRAEPGVPALLAALRVERGAVLGALLLGVVAVSVAFVLAAHARPQEVVPPVPPDAVTAGVGDTAPDGPLPPGVGGPDDPAPAATGATGQDLLVVDVAGLVRRPGLVKVPPGSRVNDAIEAAGGLRRRADTRSVNLARPVADGEQIVVAGPDEAGAVGSADGAPAGGARVSLSAATTEQLESLPGVGPVLAQRIVEHRESIGGRFTSVEQLRDVTGIGDVTYADLEPRVQP